MQTQEIAYYAGALAACRDVDGLGLFDFEFSESGSEVSAVACRLIGYIHGVTGSQSFAAKASWSASSPGKLHLELVSEPEEDLGSTISLGHSTLEDGVRLLESLCELEHPVVLEDFQDLCALSASSRNLSNRDSFRSKTRIYNSSSELFDILEDFQKERALSLVKNFVPTQELSF